MKNLILSLILLISMLMVGCGHNPVEFSQIKGVPVAVISPAPVDSMPVEEPVMGEPSIMPIMDPELDPALDQIDTPPSDDEFVAPEDEMTDLPDDDVVVPPEVEDLPDSEEEPSNDEPEFVIIPQDPTVVDQIGDFEDEEMKCKAKGNAWGCKRKKGV